MVTIETTGNVTEVDVSEEAEKKAAGESVIPGRFAR